MVTAALPFGLNDWREAPRVRAMNDRASDRDGHYVLCWLQHKSNLTFKDSLAG